MRVRAESDRGGATTGDVLVVLSILTLGFSLLYPRLRERGLAQRLDGAASAVEAVRQSARSFYEENRDWPAPRTAGVTPPELSAALPGDSSFTFEHYTLEWNRWEITEAPVVIVLAEPTVLPEEDDPMDADSAPPSPPPTLRSIGGITLHSGETAILAGLFQRYGAAVSFVRDTMWTLILPQRSDPRNDVDPAR